MDPVVLVALAATMWLAVAVSVFSLVRAAALGDAAMLELRSLEEPASGRPAAAPVPTLGRSGYPAVVLDRVAEHAATALRAEDLRIEVRGGRRGGSRILAAAVGPAAGQVGSLTRADGLAAEVIRTGESRAGEGGISRPLLIGGSVAGAITARGPSLGPAELELLHPMADAAGLALDHREERSATDSRLDSQVETLVASVRGRLDLSGTDTLALGRLARETGVLLGLEGPSLVELGYAARLHGAGKLRLPDTVLMKSEPLAGDERSLVRSHPALAARILSDVPGLEAVALIVRWHRERFDGKGYPDGLCGERIPIESRIVGTCAALGAMLSERPYRDPVPVAAALAELREMAGAQFDPRVVAAICQVAPTIEELRLVPEFAVA